MIDEKVLIERLEEKATEEYRDYNLYKCERALGNADGLKHAINIANQLAEEERRDNNWETTRQYLDEKYFSKIRELSSKYDYPCENIAINFDWVFGLIAKIESQLAEEDKTCYKNCTECEAYDMEKHYCPKFCEVLKEAAKELTEEFNNGWIPCSERLPIGDEYRKIIDGTYYYKHVLTTTNDIDIPIRIGWYDQEDEVWYDLKYSAYYPIAWQSLPATYQPKGEGF